MTISIPIPLKVLCTERPKMTNWLTLPKKRKEKKLFPPCANLSRRFSGLHVSPLPLPQLPQYVPLLLQGTPLQGLPNSPTRNQPTRPHRCASFALGFSGFQLPQAIFVHPLVPPTLGDSVRQGPRRGEKVKRWNWEH